MFRKELVVLGGIAVAVFLVVAGIASLAVRAVQAEASLVAQDTLPGLVNAGEAVSRLNENWFNTYQLLNVASPTARASLMNRIETNSTSELWERYEKSIYDPKDAQLFQKMGQSRTEFLVARSNYFNLVKSGQMTEARNFFEGRLDMTAQNYRWAAGDIFIYNADVGQQRADRIIRLSRWTPFVLGGLCVGILLVGMFIGFKASLGAFSRNWGDEVDSGK